MYLLRRISDGKYVAKSGYHTAYTCNIDKIRGFSTKEEAMLNMCPQSEVIVRAGDIFLTKGEVK